MGQCHYGTWRNLWPSIVVRELMAKTMSSVFPHTALHVSWAMRTIVVPSPTSNQSQPLPTGKFYWYISLALFFNSKSNVERWSVFYKMKFSLAHYQIWSFRYLVLSWSGKMKCSNNLMIDLHHQKVKMVTNLFPIYYLFGGLDSSVD